MKHAVIVGHPDPKSFNLMIASHYCGAVRARGQEAVLRDLYRVGFDPVLRDEELPAPGKDKPAKDVLAERRLIADADVFAFVYPLWFNAPPAIIKGYMDRVFGLGFGFGPISQGGNAPLLAGKQLLGFSSSGAPADWLRKEGGLMAIRNLFDEHFAAVCGLKLLDHVHFGGIHPMMAPHVIEEAIARVDATVARFFSDPPASSPAR
jgi:NAD(P)H dehydrogenase (quinone)